MKQPFRPSLESPFDDPTDEFTPRPPMRAAWCGFVVIVVLIFALLLSLHFIAVARAQDRPRLVFDCVQFATYARGMATLRDIGANRDKVIAELRKDMRPGLMLAVLEREAKLVWSSNAPRLEIEHGAYKRCQGQLGNMGLEG